MSVLNIGIAPVVSSVNGPLATLTLGTAGGGTNLNVKGKATIPQGNAPLAATVGLSGRGFILGSVYASVLIFSWPIRWPLLFVGLLGITDALFDLRGLIARRRAPPAAPT